MEWLADIFNSLANNPGAVNGVTGGGAMIILSKLIDYLRGRNKADIVEAETDLEQIKAQLAPLEKVTEALVLSMQNFGDLASAIKESSQASTQASQAIVAALEKLNTDSTEKHERLQTSVGQMELSMVEVAKTMNDIKTDTGGDGQILIMLRQIALSVDSLANEVKNWGEQNRQKETEMLSKIEAQGQKVAEIEKRITQEAPQATVTESKSQTYTPKKSPKKITSEQKTIGNTTQPIQPPDHIESKEEKPNDESN